MRSGQRQYIIGNSKNTLKRFERELLQWDWQEVKWYPSPDAAFWIHKSDLRIRPVWHQKQDRVLAHILVCFLAYVLWQTLAALTCGAGMGDESRRIFDELGTISLMDVILPTRTGPAIRRPTEHQAILLDLPSRWKVESDVVKTFGPDGVKNTVFTPKLRNLG